MGMKINLLLIAGVALFVVTRDNSPQAQELVQKVKETSANIVDYALYKQEQFEGYVKPGEGLPENIKPIVEKALSEKKSLSNTLEALFKDEAVRAYIDESEKNLLILLNQIQEEYKHVKE